MSSEMRGLLYGAKPESHNHHCGCMSAPDAPACLAPATWHGIVLTEDCGSLLHVAASCDEHKFAMALSAHFIHAHESACQLPGSRVCWDCSTGRSCCYIDWDLSTLDVGASEPVSA